MHEAIYERLKAVAREGKTITYGEIAPLAGLDMANEADRIKITELLQEIGSFELQHNRPMLPAVVVQKSKNMPGQGFFRAARRSGAYKGNDDPGYFQEELRKVHEYWKQA
jgi:hypothetical protein